MAKQAGSAQAHSAQAHPAQAQTAQVFAPRPEFSARAVVNSMQQYEALWQRAKDDPEGFWGELAHEELHWFEPFAQALDWKEPFAKWFVGGRTNVSHNCLDVHLSTPRRNKAAIIWEGEPGDTRTLTYQQLHIEVCKFANVLKSLGLKKGDVASIYMPMVPELAIAMLACARIGVVHSVIFGGFSSEAIADRNHDASAKVVITADAGWRRGKQVPLKANVDEALKKSPTVKHCIVLRRCGNDVTMQSGRDHWWHDLMKTASADCPAEPMDAEATLYILYTSGSTGKPKGIRHTTAGYNLYVKKTFQWVFDYRDDDVYWCTADIGWVTGHSYIVYGPLSAGATSLMYEGAPNHPHEDRFWDIIDRHQVNIFYTAPTAIRAFIKWGNQWPEKHSLKSLRLLGTVGEPINPAAWLWYHEKIGGGRCPIVDTWWQTETGGILISPLPGATPTKPGSCTRPLPGIVPEVVDVKTGQTCPPGQQGMLVIAKPWPGMLRGIWGDDERYQKQYWSTVPHKYLTGDNSMCDADGYFWVFGRLDDVLNVSGHRLSTTEIESALVSHPAVAEAAAVPRPDEIKGEAICVFVTLKSGEPSEEMKQDLRKHVRTQIGAHAMPDDVRFAAALPKTRSGKIMRRLLRDIASGKAEITQDTTTLEDYTVLAKLRGDEE
jgi:acetyl-CoA synthetase